MRSKKRVKPLAEIVKPYIFTPTKRLRGAVNGEEYDFPKGKPAELTFSQYQNLLHAGEL